MAQETLTQRRARDILALLPIIIAAAEGKTIQYQWMDKSWHDDDQLNFMGEKASFYRIKPEEPLITGVK